MTKISFVKNPTTSKDMPKTNKEFVIYFSNKLKEKTGYGLVIPSDAWYPFISRVKGFRTKMKLDEQQYKAFVDKVIEVFFAQPGYVPTFGSIVSEKVFYVVKTMNKPATEFTDADFRKLRDKLLGDINIVFKVD
jgi:hypothetical protein